MGYLPHALWNLWVYCIVSYGDAKAFTCDVIIVNVDTRVLNVTNVNTEIRLRKKLHSSPLIWSRKYLILWGNDGQYILHLSWCNRSYYSDVIMGAMASQITSLTIIYSTFYWGTDQRKHQSSVSLAFVKGIHRWPVNSTHKGPVKRKMFPFDDVIMEPLRSVLDIKAKYRYEICQPHVRSTHIPYTVYGLPTVYMYTIKPQLLRLVRNTHTNDVAEYYRWYTEAILAILDVVMQSTLRNNVNSYDESALTQLSLHWNFGRLKIMT